MRPRPSGKQYVRAKTSNETKDIDALAAGAATSYPPARYEAHQRQSRRFPARMLHRLLRFAYRRLPIDNDRKLRLKAKLFATFPGLFKDLPAYQTWKRQVEGRSRLPADHARAAPPAAPTPGDWDALDSPSHRHDAAHADARAPYVVVPVYAGHDETLACLHSVLRSTPRGRFELVVIHDAGPEPALLDTLRELAARGLFTLLENSRNLGFVKTANRGMRLYDDRDVVLLNSDTEVYGDWLDRLQAVRAGAPDIATVTPLTNNGEIASFPFWLANNEQVLELDYASLDAAASRVNAGAVVDAPTGVGFCMYVSRAALRAVGDFDEAAFPRGYGEENDLCRRMADAGWRNVIAADTFVRHFGAVSFGTGKLRLTQQAGQTVERRHPGYHALIQSYIRDDPLKAARTRLDAARWRGHFALDRPDARISLFVLHGLDGGTRHHAEYLASRLLAEGRRVVFMLPDPVEPRHAGLHWTEAEGRDSAGLVLNGSGVPVTPNLQNIDIDRDTPALIDALRVLNVGHVHLHHLLGYGPSAAAWFARLQEALDLPFDITLHDYTAVCPRVHCADGSGRFCGLPDLRSCESCIRTHGRTVDTPSVWLWRRQCGALLAGAGRVFAPTPSLARTIEHSYPGTRVRVRPHPEDLDALPFDPARADGRPVRRVALLGAIGEHKGHGLLLAMARDAQARKLPLDFAVIGYSADDAQLRRAGVTVTGRYTRAELRDLVARLRPDAALFLSLVPETYCFTLSEALALGLFPIGIDLGAIGDRLRELGWGALWPLAAAGNARALNDRLLDTTATPAPAAVAAREWVVHYPLVERDYYGDVEATDGRAAEA